MELAMSSRKQAAAGPLAVEWVPLERLTLNPANPRLNDAAVPHVAASLTRFGWQQPIVAKRSGEVIAGNTRLKAARSVGMKSVPVVWFGGSDLDAVAFGIADNKLHDLSSFDQPALAKLIDELRREDVPFDGLGFAADEINDLLSDLQALIGAAVEDPGPAEIPSMPVSHVGDLWVLGEHRLLCGDSRKQGDVDRVLAGGRPVLIATDPPYGCSYSGAERPAGSGKNWTATGRGADVAPEDLDELLDGFLLAALARAAKGVAVYVWHATVRQPAIATAFAKHGLLLHQVLVWTKPTPAFSFAFYAWQHEPCAFGWREGEKPPRRVDGIVGTVWPADWEGKARVVGNEHPTQKPVRLFELPMEMHTKRGDVVLESFAGSGSQIIAAEKLGRRCRAIEISPAFVDVAVRRWEEATRKKAMLESSGGKSFEATAVERGVPCSTG